MYERRKGKTNDKNHYNRKKAELIREQRKAEEVYKENATKRNN